MSSDQVNALTFIDNFFVKLVNVEINTMGPFLPPIVAFLKGIPNFKPLIDTYIKDLQESISNVNNLKIDSDIDFFINVIGAMKQPLPEAVKRPLIGAIAIMPTDQLKQLRDTIKINNGTVITKMINTIFSHITDAVNAASVMTTNQAATTNGSTSNNGKATSGASFGSVGGVRRNSRKGKKSKKSKTRR